jgi:hypothetical protein
VGSAREEPTYAHTISPPTDSTIARVGYHLYAHLQTDNWSPSLLEGKLETAELLPQRLLVNAHDPRGASKPFFMGEAGIDDGNKGDNQTNRFSFAYGVWMAHAHRQGNHQPSITTPNRRMELDFTCR